jgi:putative nucleotidyltransferase with HDIG domain
MYDMNAKTSDITRLIELDAALTANLLRWANSAYFGSRMKVASVRTAVVRMGMNNIIRLSLGDCLAASMRKSLPGYGLGESVLWHHNVAAALTVESLGQFIHHPLPPAAFTAALLHDVGKYILGPHLDEEGFLKMQKLTAEGFSTTQAERFLLETDHAEVGAAMASYWKFPDDLVYAIEQHHDLNAKEDLLGDAVKIANAVAKQLESKPISESYETIMLRQGLTADKIGLLCGTVEAHLARIEKAWMKENENEDARPDR